MSLFILPLLKTKSHYFHLDQVFYKIISCFSFLVLHFTISVGYPCFDCKLRVAFIHVLQGCTVCQKRRSHLKILVARKVAWIKFRWEAPQILGPTLQNLALTATWRSGFEPDILYTNTATSQTAPARLHLNIVSCIVSDEHWYTSLSFRTVVSGTMLKVKWFVWMAFKIRSTPWIKSDKTLDFFITSLAGAERTQNLVGEREGNRTLGRTVRRCISCVWLGIELNWWLIRRRSTACLLAAGGGRRGGGLLDQLSSFETR